MHEISKRDGCDEFCANEEVGKIRQRRAVIAAGGVHVRYQTLFTREMSDTGLMDRKPNCGTFCYSCQTQVAKKRKPAQLRMSERRAATVRLPTKCLFCVQGRVKMTEISLNPLMWSPV